VRWPPVAAWTCAALAVAAFGAALVLRGIDDEPARSAFAALGFAAFSIPALVAGVAIARKRPANAVGPIVAGLGLVPALDVAFDAWAGAAVDGHVAGAGWAALLYNSDWIPVFGLLALLLLLFPDGRPPGPRWRWAVWLAIGAPVLVAVIGAFRDEPFDAPYADVARPLPALPDGLDAVLSAVGLVALLAAVVLAAIAMIVRFRRSRGVERIQIKWLAAGAILLPVALVAGIAEGTVTDGTGPVTLVSFLAAYLALTGAVAVAMLRHGLYDVDRVISRTIAWLAMSIVLAAGVIAVALVVAVPLGGGSTAAAAAAAVAAALAFDPLRRRLQRVVDRRFDRDRTSAVARVEAFAARLRDGTAEPEDIEAVLRETLGDPGLRLLVWLPEHGVHADLAGVARDAPLDGGGRTVTGVGRGSAPLGLIVHADRLLERPGLLADVVRAAALPVEVARLRCELRRRLEEVEESRARIVRAGYEERRRLERDLHDGAQQRLVALGMALRRVQRRPGADPEVVRSLDGAVDELAEAVAGLREIARGLRPSALDDGLGPALADLARRSPLPVGVEGPPEGLPPEIETAAYYVVLEAVANAVKHADATRVDVRAERLDGRLVVTIADDGCGGAAATTSGGLAGLADRVAAHGGAITVDSPIGAGTRLEVVLPCGS
jgi:signal transduction histidine kinase